MRLISHNSDILLTTVVWFIHSIYLVYLEYKNKNTQVIKNYLSFLYLVIIIPNILIKKIILIAILAKLICDNYKFKTIEILHILLIISLAIIDTQYVKNVYGLVFIAIYVVLSYFKKYSKWESLLLMGFLSYYQNVTKIDFRFYIILNVMGLIPIMRYFIEQKSWNYLLLKIRSVKVFERIYWRIFFKNFYILVDTKEQKKNKQIKINRSSLILETEYIYAFFIFAIILFLLGYQFYV